MNNLSIPPEEQQFILDVLKGQPPDYLECVSPKHREHTKLLFAALAEDITALFRLEERPFEFSDKATDRFISGLADSYIYTYLAARKKWSRFSKAIDKNFPHLGIRSLRDFMQVLVELDAVAILGLPESYREYSRHRIHGFIKRAEKLPGQASGMVRDGQISQKAGRAGAFEQKPTVLN